MFRIEKNVPVPNNKYPLDQMVPGDSFFADRGSIPNIRTLIHRRQIESGVRFLTRKEADGYRVWRIS